MCIWLCCCRWAKDLELPRPQGSSRGIQMPVCHTELAHPLHAQETSITAITKCFESTSCALKHIHPYQLSTCQAAAGLSYHPCHTVKYKGPVLTNKTITLTTLTDATGACLCITGTPNPSLPRQSHCVSCSLSLSSTQRSATRPAAPPHPASDPASTPPTPEPHNNPQRCC